MNACTNPHDSKLRHWFQARARHADGRPKAKRHRSRRKTETFLAYCHEFRPVIWGYVLVATGFLAGGVG